VRLRNTYGPRRNWHSTAVFTSRMGQRGLACLERAICLVFVMLKLVKASLELAKTAVQRRRHIVLHGVDVLLQGRHMIIQRFQLFGHFQLEGCVW